SREERDQHIEITKTYLKQIPFEKYYFLDHKIIVKHFMHQMNDLMKRHFLGKFYHDTLMMETLRVYLDSNLNMVNAAKKLYIHRNTLIQRIDKFYQLTGFDVRLFIDALLVYHLIQ
ncbi:MAG: helix-turn-helix domain-containing protein, partial [Acholeplasmataceae bacterium]|nr:helix-turn-helix domain-containing protein [Acholeplasmataceae bacterium]